MITLLAFAALSRDMDPLARYVAFRAAHPTIEVSCTASVNGKQTMAGTFMVQPPKRFIYKAAFGGYDYSLASSEKAYVEIERSRNVYDELPITGGLIAYGSDINGRANSVMPRFFFLKDFKSQFPAASTKLTKKDGFDELYVKVAGQMGVVREGWMDVDAEGKILMLRQHIKSPAGENLTEWNLSNYRYPDVSLSAFVTPIPLGFVPHTIPRLTTPLAIGNAAPVDGWSSPRGSRTVNLLEAANRKPFLIAVLGEDSAPNKAAKSSLPTIAAKLPVFVIGKGGYSDPSGKLLARLSVPATPMFYLIDGAGKVRKLWMGFDSRHASGFEQEVIQSAQGTSATR